MDPPENFTSYGHGPLSDSLCAHREDGFISKQSYVDIHLSYVMRYMICIYARIPLQKESVTFFIRETWNLKHTPPLEYDRNLMYRETSIDEGNSVFVKFKDCYQQKHFEVTHLQSVFLSTRETLYQRKDCFQ